MDFYQRQDEAKSTSFRLYLLLALGVTVITALVSALVFVLISLYSGETNPLVTMAYSVPLSVMGIGGASFLKTSQIRSGGGAYVAASLGGRQIDFTTLDGPEKQLANIVEEIALAAGMPVPNVYVLDNEPGINAFAAGWTPQNSVIGVTRGALQHLTRNELQGVIAHEFAHIYNGDTKIKTKLIGLVFGILVLAFAGRLFLEQGAFGRRSNSKDNSGAAVVIGIGIALVVIGYAGTWFARMIQAAVSRQREYLADASGVQFTRDPDSLGRALSKIGGMGEGGKIISAHSTETSHLFFASAMRGGLATHPPLRDRIKRLIPSWNGEFQAPQVDRRSGQANFDKDGDSPLFPQILPDIEGLPKDIGGIPTDIAILGMPAAGLAEAQSPPKGAAYQAPNFEGPTLAHLDQAHALIEQMPPHVADQLRTSYGAAASLLGLLLSDNPDVAATQLHDAALISGLDEDYLLAASRNVSELISHLHLPAVDLALHSIHQLPYENKLALIQSVEAIENHSDGLTLFQWVLRRVLIRHLVSEQDDGYKRRKTIPLSSIENECATVLAVMAGFATPPGEQTQATYTHALKSLGLSASQLPELEGISYAEIDDALEAIGKLAVADKREFLKVAAETVTRDGVVLTEEAHLIRVIADAVGFPVPPLLPIGD